MRTGHLALRAAIVIAIAALCAADASAHHSFAPHFDATKPASIEGTVTEYESRNPHSYLHISAVDENGRTREYVCESHGVTQLTRNGIRPDMFKAGTRVRVAKVAPSELELIVDIKGRLDAVEPEVQAHAAVAGAALF